MTLGTLVVTYSPRNAAVEHGSRAWKEGSGSSAGIRSTSRITTLRTIAARIEDEVGPVDILVNNAGITRDATFKKLDKVNWDAVIRTNLDFVFNMTKSWCDGMIERGWGRIINVSSVIASKGGFGQANYAAAKAGVHGFTKALALEVARAGVTVNTISPGYIATRMVMAVPAEILKAKIIPQIPVGRLGQRAIKQRRLKRTIAVQLGIGVRFRWTHMRDVARIPDDPPPARPTPPKPKTTPNK